MLVMLFIILLAVLLETCNGVEGEATIINDIIVPYHSNTN